MMINTKTEDRAGGADEIKPAKSSIDTRLVYGFLGAGKYKFRVKKPPFTEF